MNTNEKTLSPPRGIPNVSGVACHVTSALHLVLHAISPLSAALLGEIAHHFLENKDDGTIIHLLANLTRTLQDQNEVVNPVPLYQALEQSTVRLDPHELGDAAKALRVLLHTLQHDSSLLQPILQHCLMGATLEQTMVGECMSNEKQVCRCIQTRTRLAPCPFSIPVNEEFCNLQEALAHATIVPQIVANVDWKQLSNYTREPNNCPQQSDLVDAASWKTTTKTLYFASLPLYMLIHLQRAHYQNNRVELSTREFHIFPQLDMEPYVTKEALQPLLPCCLTFQLVGAILHISEDTANTALESDDDEEGENGHYVTLVQNNNQEWYLLNDDQVTHISNEQQVLDMVSGRSDGSHGSTYCTTVLAYGQTCDCSKATKLTLLDDLRDSLLQRQEETKTTESPPCTTVDYEHTPHDLVGRRLKIRWKSGKYYSGIISSYNKESGKHCITYKDGHVRHYTLSKKTIEWIS